MSQGSPTSFRLLSALCAAGILASCATFRHAAPQFGTIAGFVSETSVRTGPTVVALVGTAYRTATSGNGSFVIRGVPSGRYEIVITRPAHDTLRLPAFTLSGGDSIVVAAQIEAIDRRYTIRVNPQPRPPPTWPLVVVDGVLHLPDTAPNLVSLRITRIEVVNQVTAVSMYGSRGLKGAIFVETRRGSRR